MRRGGFRHALLGAFLAGSGWLLGAGSPAHGQPLTSDSNVGYIDSALIGTQVRLRFDAAYGINRDDRAEFIYSKGFGPVIDYQDVSTYLELAFCKDLSAFVEIHQHMYHPSAIFPNAAGFGDMNTGVKYAFLYTDDQVATFQLRTYIPTGMPKSAPLGSGHVSINPALLYCQRLTDRLTLEMELQDYVPVGGSSDFSGNVLRYGAGLGYLAVDTPHFRLTPVVEFVGWTVLSGRESVTPDISIDSTGVTIVNAKMGVRAHFGEHSDFYVGYGRTLTGDVWYKDILRLEYRWVF